MAICRKLFYKFTLPSAGGYLIEPFNEIKDALFKNEIKIDSSVCKDLLNEHGLFSFDFRSYSDKPKYNFELTTKDIEKTGSFIEIPITTIKIPAIINVFLTIIRIIKYPHIESERKGSGVGEYFDSNRIITFKKLFSLAHSRIHQLTTDNNFKERFHYIFKKAPEYSLMIIHPKLLNNHSFELLADYVSTNKIRFISIQSFLS
jgi:hypothetical protein